MVDYLFVTSYHKQEAAKSDDKFLLADHVIAMGLFKLRFLVIFAVSSLVNGIVESRFFVYLNESVGSLLVLSTSAHCTA